VAIFGDAALPVAWGGASALLLLLGLITYARLERLSKGWPEVEIDGTRLSVSPNCGPAVFGVWRPLIVLPAWMFSLDEEARRLILTHEREHLRARDSQCLLIAVLAAVLLPWNAPLWLLVRRLRLAIELDCDERVLRRNVDARTYGSLLLTVCARRRGELPFALALAERPSVLERRIRAMSTATPRHRFLMSLPLLVAVTLLSVAAGRAPSPSLPLRARSTEVRPRPQSVAGHSPSMATAVIVGATPEQRRIRMAARQPQLPRLAVPESLPRVSATWENARIGDVIAAFATFSHRRITAAPEVQGFITASVVDQAWSQALEAVMAGQGLRVEFRADSSVYIFPPARSGARESEGSSVTSRTISGTVVDDQSGAPISGARINLAGVQLVGRPNETLTTERGQFSLPVPDGEVWLDACAPGYEFDRVTLAPAETSAVFHGRRSIDRSAADTMPLVGRARDFLYVFGGQVVHYASPCGMIPDPRYYGQVVHIRIF
jgi:hypothetical protein